MLLILQTIRPKVTVCLLQMNNLYLLITSGTLSGLLGLGNISGFVAPLVTAQLVTKVSLVSLNGFVSVHWLLSQTALLIHTDSHSSFHI